MKDRRLSKRLPLNLKAQYFLKEKKGNGRECTVINISRNGTGLAFYTFEKIDIGSSLFLEIFDAATKEAISVKGVLRWFRQGKVDFVGGIEVTSQSDGKKLTDLIGLVQ